jgi:hypothetical protein
MRRIFGNSGGKADQRGRGNGGEEGSGAQRPSRTTPARLLREGCVLHAMIIVARV